MQICDQAEATCKIVSHFNVDANLITNEVYYFEKTHPYWHCHENLHISFVFQNGRAETKKGIINTKKDGGIFFYHSGQIHRWISPKSVSKSVNIEIESDFLKKYNLSEDAIKKSIDTNVYAKALILKIQNEAQEDHDHNFLTIQTLLLELISFSSVTSNTYTPKWVELLRSLLNDNWNKNIQLDEISETVGVHPVTISKYFRKYFSCTMSEYLRKLKIRRSIDLIKNTPLSLSEIAFSCGFSDQSHFTRNFKQQTGFLPKDFRSL